MMGFVGAGGGQVSDFVLKMMSFVLKMMNFVLKMMSFVLKMMNFGRLTGKVIQKQSAIDRKHFGENMMNFVLEMMYFAFKMMGFVLKMKDFALKMVNSQVRGWWSTANCNVFTNFWGTFY